jgi:spermidine synthase
MVNRDRNLRLQYLAGLGLDLEQSGQIYLEMLQYARFPEGLFIGSPSSVQAIRAAIDRAAGR